MRGNRSVSVLIRLAAGAALLAGLAGCGGGEKVEASPGPGSRGKAPAAKEAVPVAVQAVAIGVASSYYTATAVLEASSRAEIRARSTGVVEVLRAEEGDVVEAGAVLLELEDDQLRLRVRQAEIEARRAQREVERREQMRAAGVLSDEEYQTALNELERAEAALELARLDLSYARVPAPFGGSVVRRLVDLGAHVEPGTPLYELMDVQPLLAKVHVPANRMGFVEPGQEIELRLESNDAELIGRVRLVSPIVDASSGTVKITAEISDYPPGTRAGDFARVRIVTARHDDALLVPSLAVVEEKGDDVVYVVEADAAQRRVVTAGFVDGDLTEITTGLEADERVIVKGHRGLQSGDPVDVVEGAERPTEATAEGETETESPAT